MQRLVRFCRLLAVRCYYASFRIRLLLCTRKTSPGKRYHFHLIYLLHLRLEFRAVSDFVLSCKLVLFKTPFMQFLLVRPRFCLRLLSDSASRRTPLSLANSSYCHACSGLSPPSYYTCRAHTWHSPPVSDDRWAVLCLLFHLLFEFGSHFFETAFFPYSEQDSSNSCCNYCTRYSVHLAFSISATSCLYDSVLEVSSIPSRAKIMGESK